MYFHCHTVHIVELLNYYTNHCIYIKFIKFYICAVFGVIIEYINVWTRFSWFNTKSMFGLL